MTDIWRSFIAQRCLWEMGHSIVFHTAEAHQVRNPHNLLKDFEDECPGYLGNTRFAKVLEALSLQPGAEHVTQNMRQCYTAAVDAGFFPKEELQLLDAWLSDIAKISLHS